MHTKYMAKAVQKRTLQTRARLLSMAGDLVKTCGYEGLRVEEIVLGASVAKGTFFAHFRDKDALMEILIGAEMDSSLDQAEAGPVPVSIPGMISAMRPYHQCMMQERYVFDLILRYSGAAAIAEIGPIANTLGRYVYLVEEWVKAGSYRTDISPELIAEGVQGFAIQSMSLQFCALHESTAFEDRLKIYWDAWMLPQSPSN